MFASPAAMQQRRRELVQVVRQLVQVVREPLRAAQFVAVEGEVPWVEASGGQAESPSQGCLVALDWHSASGLG